MDVEQVPDKLFSYHRILSRPQMDVELVPDKPQLIENSPILPEIQR